MMELLGKIFLFVGCSALGVYRGERLRLRRACLQSFRRSLETMGRELSFSLCPLEELLKRVEAESDGIVQQFYSACRLHFAESGKESWMASWQAAIQSIELPLQESDRRALQEVGVLLGRYDAESQRQGLEAMLVRWASLVETAQEEERRLVRVYTTVGVAVGLFCVILL